MGGNQSNLASKNNANNSISEIPHDNNINSKRHKLNQRSSSLQHVPESETSVSSIKPFFLRRRKSEAGPSTLIVVKKPDVEEFFDITKDPVILRLKEIPLTDPIFRNNDKVHWSTSAEVERARSKLDPSPLLNIGLLLQTRTRANIKVISKEQNKLSQKVKETDSKVTNLFQSYTRRQKETGKLALQLNKITDFAHLLIKCQGMLNETKRLTCLLNDMLPENERLEPFQVEDDKELMEIEFKPTIHQADLPTSDSESSAMDFLD